MKQWNNGTTLVEILLTISIITLLMATGIPAFRSFSQQNELSNQADFFKDAIISTQNFALSPEYDKDANATHYIFMVEQGDRDHYLIARGKCNDDGPISSETTIVKTSKIPSGIDLLATTNANICYDIKNQGRISYPLDGDIGDEGIKFSLTKEKLSKNKTRYIRVNKSTGQVTISKNDE